MTVALLALLVASIWGVAPIFEKLSLVKTAPFTALTIRFIITTSIVVAISLVTGQFKDIRNVDPVSLFWIALGGISGGVIGLFLYFVVLKRQPHNAHSPHNGDFPVIYGPMHIYS